jgi:hypothetical protein
MMGYNIIELVLSLFAVLALRMLPSTYYQS